MRAGAGIHLEVALVVPGQVRKLPRARHHVPCTEVPQFVLVLRVVVVGVRQAEAPIGGDRLAAGLRALNAAERVGQLMARRGERVGSWKHGRDPVAEDLDRGLGGVRCRLPCFEHAFLGQLRRVRVPRGCRRRAEKDDVDASEVAGCGPEPARLIAGTQCVIDDSQHVAEDAVDIARDEAVARGDHTSDSGQGVEAELFEARL